MAIYKKTLKEITVFTLGGGEFSIADTVDNPFASNALMEFESFQTMHLRGEEYDLLIPFHAVGHIVVGTSQSEDINKADAYGCEDDESEGGSEK